ncbi:MAG: glycosyltransferase [Rhodospirillales bacterium]|nr:glycosyltransferase [Rhodospirillales bacterium]
MITNTFTPHRGGVARSIEAFTAEYRKRGHRVLVIAPEFEDMPRDELDVVRVPAIQHFNGSDFSVVLPIPGFLRSAIEDFRPDIVHSHHPFLLGATAIRVARSHLLPLVFTHHTMYEHYTHYVPGDSPAMKRFVIDLATSYANLCNQVLTPSESTATVLRARGVTTPIDVVPTGVATELWRAVDGAACRKAAGIPREAFVVGHVGRLAPEKSLTFLAEAVSRFLATCDRAHFLVVGSGDSEKDICRILGSTGLGRRLHCLGSVGHPALGDAYGAMDVFAFASKSETQGMVLTEAMAAGVPVVALDAPGVREVVRESENGRLLPMENVVEFASALSGIEAAAPAERQRLIAGALATAGRFSIGRTAEKALAIYDRLRGTQRHQDDVHYDSWMAGLRLIEAEWNVISGLVGAASAALTPSSRDSGAHS